MKIIRCTEHSSTTFARIRTTRDDGPEPALSRTSRLHCGSDFTHTNRSEKGRRARDGAIGARPARKRRSETELERFDVSRTLNPVQQEAHAGATRAPTAVRHPKTLAVRVRCARVKNSVFIYCSTLVVLGTHGAWGVLIILNAHAKRAKRESDTSPTDNTETVIQRALSLAHRPNREGRQGEHSNWMLVKGNIIASEFFAVKFTAEFNVSIREFSRRKCTRILMKRN